MAASDNQRFVGEAYMTPDTALPPLDWTASLFAIDPIEREVLRRYMTNRGAAVRDSATLPQALESSDGVQAIVLRLTSTTGAVPVEMVRQRGITLPVLALADRADVSIAAYRHGADIVAQLPLDLDLLCCTVDVLVRRAAERRAA
jgi:DNA-binding response OmpR family regulator